MRSAPFPSAPGAAALPVPCLALVTDRRLCTGRPLEEKVARALAGGVHMVQLREKDMPGGELLALARRLRTLTQGKALLMINNRVDVALACQADGVQLGEEALPPQVARRLVGEGVLIGRSVHSVERAAEAQRNGADFLVVGAIFQSRSHPGEEPAGLRLLEQVRLAVRVPFLAIGGVTAANVASVVAAGASGAAVISAILGAPDPAAAASELRAALERAAGPAMASQGTARTGSHRRGLAPNVILRSEATKNLAERDPSLRSG